MAESRRLDTASELAGSYQRVLCARCGGQGCALCNNGYTWLYVYAEGRGEQGDEFDDLDEPVIMLTDEQVKSALDRGIDVLSWIEDQNSRRR
jgi:hypothetical protein